jgi:membrane protein
LLVVGGLVVSSYLLALPWLAQANQHLGLDRYLLDLAPFLITWIGLLAMYLLIPNRRVAPRHALGGALLAALAFSAARHGFALYVLHMGSYRAIYGALAALPIFLVWVYVSWVIVLAGASLTAAFAAFQYVPQAMRLPRETEFVGLLRVLAALAAAQQRGAPVDNAALRRALPFLTEDTLTRYLDELEHARLLQRSELGDWLLTRSLHGVHLADLYAAGHYRLPASAALLASAAQELPAALAAQITALGQALESGLAADLASLQPVTDTSRSAAHSSST